MSIVKSLPNMRVDLDDFKRTFEVDRDRSNYLKFVQRHEWASSILHGFRIEILDQVTYPLKFKVYNGYAVDRLGTLTYKETSDVDYPDDLLDDLTVSKEILASGITHCLVEVEFTWVDGQNDGRGFWDPTVENGSEPSGDPLPDGQEVALSVPKMSFKDWKVYVSPDTATPSYESDFFTGTAPTVKFPIAILEIAAGAIATAGVTSTFSTTVRFDPRAGWGSAVVPVNDAKWFRVTDQIEIRASDGTLRNTYDINDIDRINNIIEVADAGGGTNTIGDGVVASDVVIVTGGSAIPTSFYKEWEGEVSTYYDIRNLLFAHTKNSEKSEEGRSLIVDPKGLTPESTTYRNSSLGTGLTGYNTTVQDESIRTENRIASLLNWVKAMEYVVREMKQGPYVTIPSADRDSLGAIDNRVQQWTGIHSSDGLTNSQGLDDDFLGRIGSLAEVGYARESYPAGTTTSGGSGERFTHTSLQGNMEAVRHVNITVGNGVTNFGDFNGAQGFINALVLSCNVLSSYRGTIYVKAGYYDLTGLTVPALVYLNKGWSLIGAGDPITTIEFTNNATSCLHVVAGDIGVSDENWGTIIKGIRFVRKVAYNRALLTISIDTSGTVETYSNQHVLVEDCSFATAGSGVALGATTLDLVTQYPMVVVGSLLYAATFNYSRGVIFNKCTWKCAGGGQVWTTIGRGSAAAIPSGTAGNAVIEDLIFVKFSDCIFDANGKYLHGNFIFSQGSTDSKVNDQFIFNNCQFFGLSVQTENIIGDHSRIACIVWNAHNEFYVSKHKLLVHGCTFEGDPGTYATQNKNILDVKGYGIYISVNDNAAATVNTWMDIKDCVFQHLQAGIWATHGKLSVNGCSFQNNQVGVLAGSFDGVPVYNKIQLNVMGCDFIGSLVDFDVLKDTSDIQDAARSIGIILGSTSVFRAYGDDQVDAASLYLYRHSNVSIQSSNFYGLGVGISAFPTVLSVIAAISYPVAQYEHLNVSGCNFNTIAGPAIDAAYFGYDHTIPADAAFDVMDISNNTFKWCTWASWWDMFSHAGVATFPLSSITIVGQNCITFNAAHVRAISNTFDGIGNNCWPAGVIANSYFPDRYDTIIDDCGFYAVMGNNKGCGLIDLVIKGNSVMNFNNLTQLGAWDPTAFTAPSGTSKCLGCWVGSFWMKVTDNNSFKADFDAVDRAGVCIDISGNTVNGVYNYQAGTSLYSTGGGYQNGFMISNDAGNLAANEVILASLNFVGNTIRLSNGRFSLLTSAENHDFAWKNLVVTNNVFETSNVTNVGYAMYPTDEVDRVGAFGLVAATGEETYYCHVVLDSVDSFFLKRDAGAGDTSNQYFYSMKMSFKVIGNTFHMSGDSDLVVRNTMDWGAAFSPNCADPYRCGLLVPHFEYNSYALTDVGNVIHCLNGEIKSNVFEGCRCQIFNCGDQPVLPDQPLSKMYRLDVVDNTFVGYTDYRNSSAGYGYLRGIFYLNCTGHYSGFGQHVEVTSVLKFSGNTIDNGSVLFRFHRGISWMAVNAGVAPYVVYRLILTDNTFRGIVESVPPFAGFPSQFDFIGGLNGVAIDSHPFIAAGDLYGVPGVSNPSDTDSNAVIFVANNSFGGEVAWDGNAIVPAIAYCGNILAWRDYTQLAGNIWPEDLTVDSVNVKAVNNVITCDMAALTAAAGGGAPLMHMHSGIKSKIV